MANLYRVNNTSNLTTASAWNPAQIPTSVDNIYWNGGIASGNLSTSVSTSGVRLQVNTISLTSAQTLAVTIAAGTGGIDLYGGGIDLLTAGANLNIAAPIALNATQTWKVASAKTLAVSTSITAINPASPPTLTFDGAGFINITYPIPSSVYIAASNTTVSNFFDIVKNGTGNLTLTTPNGEANGFIGNVTLNSGNIIITQSVGPFGAANNKVTINSGCYVNFSNIIPSVPYSYNLASPNSTTPAILFTGQSSTTSLAVGSTFKLIGLAHIRASNMTFPSPIDLNGFNLYLSGTATCSNQITGSGDIFLDGGSGGLILKDFKPNRPVTVINTTGNGSGFTFASNHTVPSSVVFNTSGLNSVTIYSSFNSNVYNPFNIGVDTTLRSGSASVTDRFNLFSDIVVALSKNVLLRSVNASGNISGQGGVIAQVGTIISGNNSFTGGLKFQNVEAATGTVSLASPNAAGVGPLTLSDANITVVLSTPTVTALGLNGTAGGISLNGNSLLINAPAGTFTCAAGFSGTGTIIKDGVGTQVFNTSSTYNPTLYLKNGILQVAGTLPIGTATTSSNKIIFQGGTLQYAAGHTLDYSSRIQAVDNPAIIDTNTNTVTFAALSSSQGLTKVGAGTLILSGSSACNGNVTVSAGVLQANVTTALSSVSKVSIGQGAELKTSIAPTQGSALLNVFNLKFAAATSGTCTLRIA